MRENIGLYRGKRIDNDEWVEGFLCKKYFHEAPNDRYVIQYKTVQDGKMWRPDYMVAEVDQETIGQYTGRIDKNKKRVFEGDIIRLCNGLPGFDVGVILWDDNDQAYLIVSDPVGKLILDDFGHYGRPEYYEVIGNICDNPELLEASDG